jgi:hypothetical protein
MALVQVQAPGSSALFPSQQPVGALSSRQHQHQPTLTSPRLPSRENTYPHIAMADVEGQTPIEGTSAEDVEMDDETTAADAAGTETAELTQLEPETPKLVLFAE